MLPAVFEDGVVGTIGSGGPRHITGEAARLHRKWSWILCVRILLKGRCRLGEMYMDYVHLAEIN